MCCLCLNFDQIRMAQEQKNHGSIFDKIAGEDSRRQNTAKAAVLK